MLALKSYEQTNGFSVMDADELFFINGGSGCSIQSMSAPSTPNGLSFSFGSMTFKENNFSLTLSVDSLTSASINVKIDL